MSITVQKYSAGGPGEDEPFRLEHGKGALGEVTRIIVVRYIMSLSMLAHYLPSHKNHARTAVTCTCKCTCA